MTVSLSVSWDDSKKKRRAAAAALALVLLFPAFVPGPHRSTAAGPRESLVSVIVESLPGAVDDAGRAVAALGGRIERPLAIIDGFVAELPAGNVAALRTAPGVGAVTSDRSVQMHNTYDEQDGTATDGGSTDGGSAYDAPNDPGSMYRAAR